MVEPDRGVQRLAAGNYVLCLWNSDGPAVERDAVVRRAADGKLHQNRFVASSGSGGDLRPGEGAGGFGFQRADARLAAERHVENTRLCIVFPNFAEVLSKK